MTEVRALTADEWRRLRLARMAAVEAMPYFARALFALSPWGREHWPADAEAALQAARSDESDDQLRTAIDTLLAGKQLADPFIDDDDPEEGSDPATPD